MDFKTFAKSGGFKLLAAARLSSSAYALVCYLLHCFASGVEDVISTSSELSLLLGLPQPLVENALHELAENKVIRVRKKAGQSVVIHFNLESSKWENVLFPDKKKRSHLGNAENIHPLRRKTDVHFTPLLSVPEPKPTGVNPEVAERIYKEFVGGKKFTKQEAEKEKNYAQLLAEYHPLDQIIAFINHFGAEIPSLGLLVGGWLHFSERFHTKQHVVEDLSAFRKKSENSSKSLRSDARLELKKHESKKIKITSDEELLLQIFIKHKEPRKQLFWAIRSSHRYPNLSEFFERVKDLAHPNG